MTFSKHFERFVFINYFHIIEKFFFVFHFANNILIKF